MRKLILIKHARPAIDPTRPPSQWELSSAGCDSVPELATRIAAHQPAVLISSRETKAVQTAELLSTQLSIPMELADGLHEHDRDDVPHMQTREFLASMAMVFKQPTRRILGRETAEHACERFLRAIDAALQRHPDGNLAVVSHGTVISLAISYHSGDDPYQLWRKMGLPSFAILQLPTYELVELSQ